MITIDVHANPAGRIEEDRANPIYNRYSLDVPNELLLLQSDGDDTVNRRTDDAMRPIFICVLGTFRVLRAGQSIPLHGEKSEALLSQLALHYADGVPRSALLHALWPESEAELAGEALYSRIRSLHKLLGAALDGHAPVVRVDGCYRLNAPAGVSVDVACFDTFATTGDQQARAGHAAEAVALYEQAIRYYQGDLSVQADLHALVERERLRARYLTLLAAVATYACEMRDHAKCLAYAQRLLSHDSCREDAHRLVMRCHVRQGERAQALHQFRVCEEILHRAFNTTPEPETAALFELVRGNPGSV